MKTPRPTILAATVATALLGAAVAGVVAHAGATVKTINVSEKEFKITLTPKKASAGSVRFVVHNTGLYPHALAIAGPGVASKRTALIKPGKTARLTVTLEAGAYTLWCPVPGHAAKGMKTTLRVAGASGGGGAPATTTTGTTGGGGDAWG